MREIKLQFQGKVQTFQVSFECKDYMFLECKDNPAARGFFTSDYIFSNQK